MRMFYRSAPVFIAPLGLPRERCQNDVPKRGANDSE